MARTILIVDDDHFARLYLRDALASLDARMIEAADGREALEAVAKEKPDLVLLDLFMPVKSGMEALPEIRKACPETKILVVSSMEVPTLVEEAKAKGANDFIAKPFHPQEVLDKVKKVLGA
jgi:two-component system chemotaxis response regulator CheY